QPGDSVLVAATRKSLTEMLKKSPELLSGAWRKGGVGGDADRHEGPLAGVESMLAEVMIAPASRLQGRTLEQVGFRSLTNCVVLGIQRRSRMIRSHASELVLEPGDVLLLLGRRDDILALRGNRDLLLLEWSASDFPVARSSRAAIGTFAIAIGLAALGVIPIMTAALGGALAMLLGGCLNIRQATRALDQKVVMIIAAAIAMGQAITATGGASYVADALLSVLHDASPLVVLSSFFLMISLLTNVISNAAAAVLFTPIAISVAERIGAPVELFIIGVIFAATSSFATPFGYQTNLLVMGPGHYKFIDFVKVGLPLTLIIWAAFTGIAAWVYHLQ
ncbi:MAG: SLC13 family permease, partial [Rhodothalassiaceae bacterium]